MFEYSKEKSPAMTGVADFISQGLWERSRVPLFCRRTDYWRRSHHQTERDQGQKDDLEGYKEWSHFCALGDEVSVIINFSLTENIAGVDESVGERPRVVMMLRTQGGAWEGDVIELPSSAIKIGPQPTDIAIGDSSIQFANGAYEVNINSDALTAQIRFCPVVRPAVARSVRLSGNERMRWLVVPRLVAEGRISTKNRLWVLDNVPAYHDRNWGHFSWGGNYTWEWASILPVSMTIPWSLVYMRIGDSSRNQTYAQGLMVWHGERSSRVFHGSDLKVKESGLLEQDRTFRLPPILNLMVPGKANNIPAQMELEMDAWSDALKVSLNIDDYAQIGVPNDGPEGLTMLSEATGQAKVTGCLEGKKVQFEGRALMEFNCGVR